MEVIISDQFKSKIKKRDILTSISQSPFASLVIKKANVAIVDGTTLDSICPPEKKKFLDPVRSEAQKNNLWSNKTRYNGKNIFNKQIS